MSDQASKESKRKPFWPTRKQWAEQKKLLLLTLTAAILGVASAVVSLSLQRQAEADRQTILDRQMRFILEEEPVQSESTIQLTSNVADPATNANQ